MKITNTNAIRRLLFILLFMGVFSYALISARQLQSFLVEDMEIDEASGLVASRINPGILYTHNDSGGSNSVFVINTRGESLGRIELSGIKNRDWEEIAVGPGPQKGISYIYVGEIGDNRAMHNTVFIYRFPEPKLTNDRRFVLPIENVDKLEFRYEDGARDAEAFFVCPKTADIYIISKREEKVGIYHLPFPQKTAEVMTARKMGTIDLSMVTAADISPDGKHILVKTYTGIWQMKVKRNQSIPQALQGKMKSLKYKIEPQGEAVCWDSEGKGYYTLSERHADNPLYLNYYR